MKLLSYIAIPLVLMSQGYVLQLSLKNGETKEINVENIQDVTFEENEPEVTPPGSTLEKLPTPVVTVEEQYDGTVVAKWDAVPGAMFYTYSVEGVESPMTTRQTEVSIVIYQAGDYVLNVYAIPSDKTKYSNSETAVVRFTKKLGYLGGCKE